MSEQIEIEIIVDDTNLEIAKEEVEIFDVESTHVIDAVEERTKLAFNKVMQIARGSYLMTLGLVRAMGGGVSYMFRSMISGAFATIQALKAVALGKAMTTQDWISFAMEMGQLGLATTATIMAEMKQQQAGKAIMGAKMALMGLQMSIGGLYF